MSFRYALATTQEEQTLCYRLRYAVYVEEFGFEKPSDHPDGIETDEYDRHSIHILVTDRNTNEVAATARLVLPNPLGLPVKTFPTGIEIPSSIASEVNSCVVEVSRVAIAPRYRRAAAQRKAFGSASAGSLPPNPGTLKPEGVLSSSTSAPSTSSFSEPEIMLGILSRFLWIGRALGVRWSFFVTDTRVVKTCTTYGIGAAFVQVGKEIEYHGVPRAPYLVNADEMMARAKSLNPLAYRFMVRQSQFTPQEKDKLEQEAINVKKFKCRL